MYDFRVNLALRVERPRRSWAIHAIAR